jgi:hypothetical protein
MSCLRSSSLSRLAHNMVGVMIYVCFLPVLAYVLSVYVLCDVWKFIRRAIASARTRFVFRVARSDYFVDGLASRSSRTRQNGAARFDDGSPGVYGSVKGNVH